MSTSLRYEVENPSAKTLRKALLRQKQRIKNDEAMTEKEIAVRNETRTALIAHWVERLDETSLSKKVCRQGEEMKRELGHANKELTELRRAQLQNLLGKEQEEYAKELNNAGKTFHSQRS